MRIIPSRDELLALDDFGPKVIARWLFTNALTTSTKGTSPGQMTAPATELSVLMKRMRQELYEEFAEEHDMAQQMVHCEAHGMDWGDMLEEFKLLGPAQQTIVCWSAQGADIEPRNHVEARRRVHGQLCSALGKTAWP